jgi:Zn-dependent protease with chaperone function
MNFFRRRKVTATDAWRRRLAVADANASQVKWKILGAILAPWLPKLMAIYAFADDPGFFFLLLPDLVWLFLGTFVGMLIFARRIGSSKLLETYVDRWRSAPESVAELANEIAGRYRAFTPVSTPRVVLATRRFDIGASVVATRDRATVIVSLGWLRLLQADPAIARGILAHEIGHVAANDFRLWSLANVYNKYVLPVIVITTLPTSVAAALSIWTLVSGPATPNLPGTFIIQLMIAPLIAFGLFDRIRHHRRESEFLADFGALLTVGANSICSAVTRFDRRGLGMLATHPSSSDRIRAIEREAAAWRNELDDAGLIGISRRT